MTISTRLRNGCLWKKSRDFRLAFDRPHEDATKAGQIDVGQEVGDVQHRRVSDAPLIEVKGLQTRALAKDGCEVEHGRERHDPRRIKMKV